MSSFTYDAFVNSRSIRILELHPGPPASNPRGTLHHRNIDTVEPFEAISYAWEDSHLSNELHTPEGTIPITASLFNALLRFRSIESQRMIWADAICINQSDNDEKSQQVRLMAEIYQRSKTTLVYLGKEANHSEQALPLLCKIADANLGEGSRQFAPLDGRETGLPEAEDEGWEAIRALFRRPWFRRVWIAQEFVVSPNVSITCGDWCADWEILVAAIRNAERGGLPYISYWAYEDDPIKTDETNKGATAMFRLGWLRGSYGLGRRWPLLDLLRIFQTANSTRARDHLFAILGLASDGNDERLDPDYNEPFESFVKRYAVFFLQHDNPLGLLSYAGLGTQPHRFPSWIPDWTTSISGQNYLGHGKVVSIGRYKVSSSMKEKVVYRDKSDHVEIGGKFFDLIAEVGRNHEKADHEMNLGSLAWFVSDSERLIRSIDSYPTGEDPEEVLWRTLIGNKADDGSEPDSTLCDAYASLSRMIANLILGVDTKSQEMGKLRRNIEPILPPLLWIMTGRKFCCTQKGYVGLVPFATMPGDFVAIFGGGPVPFVLRQSPSREGCCQLIGECYIHGIMQGEAVDQHDIDMEVFNIH